MDKKCECLLCNRDMSKSVKIFGSGCLKKVYQLINIGMPRYKKEDYLFESIMKKNKFNNLTDDQKVWLTDRYLTYQYVDKIPYGNLVLLKNQINDDIQNINQIKDAEELKSSKSMSLKQAYDLYKKVIKFKDGIDKIKKGNLTDEDSIKTLITSFSYIFNMGKNKSQYEKNVFKSMQYAFWQAIIELSGRYVEFTISADFLQHSLEKEPNDILITEGKIINEIKNDKHFKENINNIVKKYGNDCDEFVFDSDNDNNFPMNFEDKDLYFAIHSSDLYVIGKKVNKKWSLDIKLHDRYDYTKMKMPRQYYNDTSSVAKSILSSTLYNFASISTKFGVMKEYNIDIKVFLNEYNVEGDI